MNFDENDSDESSDEDYIPTKDSDEDVKSEISEDDVVDDANSDNEKKNDGCKKRKLKKKCESKSFKRKGGIKLEDDKNSEAENLKKDLEIDSSVNQSTEVNPAENEEKEKERANKLWSEFLKDADDPSKLVKSDLKSSENVENSSNQVSKEVTKEFNFAGEVVRVTEVVDSNFQKSIKVVSEGDSLRPVEKMDSPLPPANVLPVVKKPGGLNSVLNKISGLKKISTLEKSRLDWNVFKTDEGISEDLQTFNRGRNGFIEKQKFLQRTDERRFELEKEFRKSGSKR